MISGLHVCADILGWQFCDHCGIGVVGQHLAGPLSGRFTLNVRTIHGVNPFQITYVFD